jgi:outer membrane biogenesis lipoprotein LolB
MPALGFSLPQRLTIEREGARLKLVVDRWQP